MRVVEGMRSSLTKVDAHVANVRACEGHKLPFVTGISHDLLIASERRVEDHLADLGALRAEGETRPNRTILEHEACVFGLPGLT